jgi:hypothetical protein
MNHSTVAAIAIFIAVASGSAHADTVTDWNQTAIEIMKVAKVSANPWSRTLAMMHVAMSDAINSVQGRYTRYVATVAVVPGASADAVAAAAAQQILLQLFPQSKGNYQRGIRGIAQWHSRRYGQESRCCIGRAGRRCSSGGPLGRWDAGF